MAVTGGSSHRLSVIMSICALCWCGIVLRLFYWQVYKRAILQAEAEQQYTRTVPVASTRGSIISSDGAILAGNQTVYRVSAEVLANTLPPAHLAKLLAPIFVRDEPVSTDAAELLVQEREWEETITKKMTQPANAWVSLKGRVSAESYQTLKNLNLSGVSFDPYEVRAYPQGTLAAHVLGFVGKDDLGGDTGYFGIEGALDRELRGQDQKHTTLKDALGFHLVFDDDPLLASRDGRTITTTIRRDIQYAVEKELALGIEKYGAKAGEVIVLDPATGAVLALAAWPSYDPGLFAKFDPTVYKNPALVQTYEPGSIFKILTVAAGLDAGVIQPETTCPVCAGPRVMGGYTIRTWNDEYRPNISMTDALVHSDNTAMIYIAEQLGQEQFLSTIKKFGIGQATMIELQEDTTTPLRQKWLPIDVATTSFGQGIVTTGMQMVKAVAAIANGGVVMQPHIVSAVTDPQTHKVLPVLAKSLGQAVSAQTAAQVTAMMVKTVEEGEAKWIRSKTNLVAAKTGTAQIPIDGHYDQDKTIASFIGFAPPDKPKFVMLVKLEEPTSSPWAAETAAPLWFSVADRLFLLLNIPPDR